MSRSRSVGRGVVVAVIVSLAAAGCSAADDSTGTPPTTANAASTADRADPVETVDRGSDDGTGGSDGLTPIERAGVSEDGADPPPPDLRGLDDPEARTEIRPGDVGVTEADRCFGLQLTLDAVADGELDLSDDLLADIEASMAECVAGGFER